MDSVCWAIFPSSLIISKTFKKTLSQLAMGFNIFSYTHCLFEQIFGAVFLLAYEVFLFYTPATVANIDN